MTRDFNPENQIVRYAPLGLIANPFFGSGQSQNSPESCEFTSEGNRLLGAILAAAEQEKPRPIWVSKETDIPSSVQLATEARVEYTLASDDELDLLHAYIPLFAMRNGAVRAVLSMLSERLVYREFDRTIALYLRGVLAAPDESLTSYQVMGPEDLAAFAKAFADDEIAAVSAIFGVEENERRPELAEVADMRQVVFTGDVDEAPADEAIEIDGTVGDAPGTGVGALADEAVEEIVAFPGVLDYIIDYTREHSSAVIARALRVYHDRGMVATAAEFSITKAPKKTLAAVAKFASVRYRKLVVMYDGFTNWLDIDDELRSKVAGLLSELRWLLADSAVFAYMVVPGTAPELEEMFRGDAPLVWDFPGIADMTSSENPDAINTTVIERWLKSASVPGVTPLTLADEGLAALVAAAEGSMSRLVLLGQEAIEAAADKGLSSLDAQIVADAAVVVAEDIERAAQADLF